jgi:hypothetical protein
MSNELCRRISGRYWMLAVLLLTGCTQLVAPPEPPPEPPPVVPPPAPSVTKPDAVLPPLDVVMIEHHRQCEASGSGSTVSNDMPQLHDLMRWLKRSCGAADTNLAPQLAALKKLRQRYVWPEAYAAWLDEWRRQLARMQVLQQRAAEAEEAQVTIVKRLRAIERDLTTRP